MTDNEKAASFIGWTVGQKCVGLPTLTEYEKCSRDKVDWWCERCGWQGRIDDNTVHHALTPDMSKLENYMRAVEAAYHGALVVPDDDRLTAFQRDGMMGALETTIRERRADPIVQYLAALYDAEHS